MNAKITVAKLLEMKQAGEKIVMLTGYDFAMARLLNESGADIILVGDSLGMVKLGYENTLPVTMEDIIYHCRSVRRGNSRALLVADMPFMSYETGVHDAVVNAGRLVKEGGAEAVKIEGGDEIADRVAAIVAAKIPVMGHIGLTPQSINQIGGFKVQGRDDAAAGRLMASAKVLEQAGASSIVLECVPESLAAEITAALSVPVISIGAGRKCDGQVLVTDDVLGLFSDFKPKFVKRYADLRPQILEALKAYGADVRAGKFPSEEQVYK